MATSYQTFLEADELNEAITESLAYVYGRVDWRSMRSNNPHDVFVHRLQTALSRPTFGQFLDKLCNGLSIQAIPYDSLAAIKRVQDEDEKAMNLLRKETRIFALKAIQRSKSFNEVKK